jgi:nicotinate-nucleotide adenylyltransferase
LSLPGPATVVPPAPPVAGRLGVFGGTFDPIHLGHLAVAEEVREVLGLERLLFVPAGDPWQKSESMVTPAPMRLALVERAIAGNPAFAVSPIEVGRAGPSFTVDTLEELATAERRAGREPDLWFILSAEALAGLATWRAPERILALARLAVVPRGGTAPDLAAAAAAFGRDFPGLSDRVRFIPGPRLELSATRIRARVAAGRSIRYLVPSAVAEAITEYALYRSVPAPAGAGQT